LKIKGLALGWFRRGIAAPAFNTGLDEFAEMARGMGKPELGTGKHKEV
jgi:hypothetical protein